MNRLFLLLTLVLAPWLHAEEPRRDRFGDPLPPGAIARLGTVNAHPAAWKISFSPDGKTIITVSNGSVRHWDAGTGRVRRVVAHPVDASDAAQVISADGRVRAIVFDDRVEIHDLERDKLPRRIEIPRLKEMAKDHFGAPHLDTLDITPNGELVILKLAEADNVLALRDGKIESWPGLGNHRHEVVFSTNSHWLTLRSEINSTEIALRQTAAGGSFQKSKPHAGSILAISPDGSTLVIRFGTWIELFDSRTGRARPDGSIKLSGHAERACFSHDGQRIGVATPNGVAVWDLKAKRFLWNAPAVVGCLAFSPDNQRLAGVGPLLHVWDVDTGRVLTPDFGPLPESLFSTPSRQGRVVTRNYRAMQLHVWDWKSGRPCFSTEFPFIASEAMAWLTADGNHVCANNLKSISVWQIATGKLHLRFNPTPPDLAKNNWNWFWEARTSFDGNSVSLLFVNGQSDELKTKTAVVRWDVMTGKLLERREFTMSPFHRARLVTDAQEISSQCDTGSESEVRILDILTRRERPARPMLFPSGERGTPVPANGTLRRVSAFQHITSDAQTATHRTVIVESATQRPLLDVAGEVWRRERASGASSTMYINGPIAFSPDGRWLALAKANGIELWDLVQQTNVPFHAFHQKPDTYSNGCSHCDELVFMSNEHLVAHYDQMTALVWELPTVTRTPPNVRLSPSTWDDLGDERPSIALRAVWAVKADQKAGVDLLRRLKRASAADENTLAGLYADLCSAAFGRREAATKRLREIGRSAETFLVAALPKSTNAEQSRRTRQLIDEFQTPGPASFDERRAVRAVHAAELIGGNASRALLADWANGDAAAILTHEAKMALARQR